MGQRTRATTQNSKPLNSRLSKLIPTSLSLSILNPNINPPLPHLLPRNFNPTLHPIPTHQRPHPPRRPRQHQIPLLQRHDPTNLPQQPRDPKQHPLRAPPLPLPPVHPQPNHHILRIWYPLLRYDFADGTEGIEPLGDRPGEAFSLGFVLDVAGGEIDSKAVGGDGRGNGFRVGA